MPTPFLLLVETGSSFPDDQWLALLALLVAIAALVVAIIGLRRAPARVPLPVPAPSPAPSQPLVAAAAAAAVAPVAELTHETLAIIAACVAMTYGRRARIAAVNPGAAGDLALQQWSIEGRRQIYSSHQVR